MDDTEVVSAVLSALADRVGQDRFELWFGRQVRLALGDSTLLVTAPSRFFQDWLRANFRKDLEIVCEQLLGRPVVVEFRLDESLARSPSPQSVEPLTAPALVRQRPPAPALAVARSPVASLNGREAPDHAESSSSGSLSRFATLETLVVGSCNRIAHASGLMVAERPGCMNPLFVHGPTGVGKTHLLQGIAVAAKRENRDLVAICVTAEQFTTQFLAGLRGSGLPSFRRRFRGVDMLLVDDIQFFANKRATLLELQLTIDALMQTGRQIVLSADRSPREIPELGAELTTRLSGGMVAKVEAPSYATRLGILRGRAEVLGLELPESVQQFIVSQVSGNAREISGAVNRLHAMSRILKTPVTRSLAEEALAELLDRDSRAIRLDDIERAVCEVFELPAESLRSNRRAKVSNAARMLAMFLSRKHTAAPLKEIGCHFGGRSHSTVIAAHKTVDAWLAQQTTIATGKSTVLAEDAIRRIEQALRKSG